MIDQRGQLVPWDKTGDQFIPGSQTQDRATATLRVKYGISGVPNAIPDPHEQLRSDLEFDLFSVVPPGYGEGVDNKLYLQEKMHNDFVHFREPFYSPGTWLGPLNTLQPMPWQWQTVKSQRDINSYHARVANRRRNALGAVREHGAASAAAFGRDVSEAPSSISSQGLKRQLMSPYEPINQLKHPWTPDLDPAGYGLNQRGFKRLFSPWRDPDVKEVQRDNGGPHLKKSRALEEIIP